MAYQGTSWWCADQFPEPLYRRLHFPAVTGGWGGLPASPAFAGESDGLGLCSCCLPPFHFPWAAGEDYQQLQHSLASRTASASARAVSLPSISLTRSGVRRG